MRKYRTFPCTQHHRVLATHHNETGACCLRRPLSLDKYGHRYHIAKVLSVHATLAVSRRARADEPAHAQPVAVLVVNLSLLLVLLDSCTRSGRSAIGGR